MDFIKSHLFVVGHIESDYNIIKESIMPNIDLHGTAKILPLIMLSVRKYHHKLDPQESCVCDSEGHHIRFLKT